MQSLRRHESLGGTKHPSQSLYGHYTSWFYVCLIAVFVVLYIIRLWSDSRVRRISSSTRPSLWDRHVALWRCVTYRKLGGPLGRRLEIPSFGVMALVVLSTVVSCIFSFAQRPWYRGHLGQTPLGSRTGFMAAAMMPLIIALAGKVNIITIITGIGHEKLNALHRWLSWIFLALSLIHTIAFLIQPLREGGRPRLHEAFYKHASFLYSGVPPLAFLVAIMALSFPIIRRAAYEFFAWSHVTMSVIFLGLLFWHFANLYDSWHYLWATMAVWLFSLLGRAFHRISFFRLSSSWLRGCPAAVHSISPDMLKMEILAPPGWSWEPGQHVFLRFPQFNLFDNHPFTIASIPNRSSRPRTPLGAPTQSSQNTLEFLIRPQSGFTRRLLHYTDQHPDALLSAVIEGPYGTALPRLENRYEDVILVAGGAGITAMLPWLLHIAERMRAGGCATRRVRLVWITRSKGDVSWIGGQLRRMWEVAPGGSVGVDVWATRKPLREVARVKTVKEAFGTTASGPAQPSLASPLSLSPVSPRAPLSLTSPLGLSPVSPKTPGLGTPMLPWTPTGLAPPVSLRFPASPVSPVSPVDSMFSGRSGGSGKRLLKGIQETVRDASSPLDDFVEMHVGARPDIEQVVGVMIGDRRTAVLGCGPEGLKIDLSNLVAREQKRVIRGQAKEVMLHTETFDF